MNIKHRIALTFICLTVGLVLLVSGIEYYFANQNTFEDFYKRLEIRAIIAAKIRFEEADMAKTAYEEVRQLHLETLPHEKEYTIPVDSLEWYKENTDIPNITGFYYEAIRNGQSRYRDHDIFYLSYIYQHQGEKYIITISAKNEFIPFYLANLKKIILLSVITTAIISALVGLWFSNRILKPVRELTRKMQNISATQLHLRLDRDKGNDEISNLTDTFNNMLDRLEATFETHKNFISNASHELNTPLTAIIGEAEFALSKQRSEAEYTDSLSTILRESERLKKITGSLLQLAQTGYTGKSQEFEPLRIDEIVYTVKELVDNIIPDNKVYIDLSLMPEDQAKLMINGNLQLLEIAFANIILNGCKYSMNKPVAVAIAATNQKVIITVQDEGIGIPAEEIAYIYDPFFRASNTAKFYGYGIGMPLTRNIVRMHSGELDVQSQVNVGTRIKISLPIYNG